MHKFVNGAATQPFMDTKYLLDGLTERLSLKKKIVMKWGKGNFNTKNLRMNVNPS